MLREENICFAFARGKRTRKIAAGFGVSYESLRKWIKQHQVGGVNNLGAASSERGTLPAHARQSPRLDTALRILVLLSWTVFMKSALSILQLKTC